MSEAGVPCRPGMASRRCDVSATVPYDPAAVESRDELVERIARLIFLWDFRTDLPRRHSDYLPIAEAIVDLDDYAPRSD